MTNNEKQALELVKELQEEDEGREYSYAYYFKALCRAIERHEAFRQEVSDAVEGYRSQLPAYLRRDIFDYQFAAFIITKLDPLAEVLDEMMMEKPCKDATTLANKIRAALAKRNGRVVFDD